VLSSAAELWPHIAISDSLVMADTAVRFAEAGCRRARGRGGSHCLARRRTAALCCALRHSRWRGCSSPSRRAPPPSLPASKPPAPPSPPSLPPLLRSTVVVLGVDFMSENVRAILDEAGHAAVGVYRLAEADIGCSLAEAAESAAYTDYLAQAAATPNRCGRHGVR
jgi:hypothetical protein